MKDTLKVYQKRLTNLSGKNRSLLLLQLAQSRFIDICSFDFLCNKPAFHIVKSLIARKSPIQLCPVVDSRDSASNKVSTRLRIVYRNDRMIFEETGTEDLYVGYPFIIGKMNNDMPIYAPLVYFPIALQIEHGTWVIKLRKDVEIGFNKTLLLAFSHFNYINFETSFLEHSFENGSKEITTFFTELYHLLENSPFEVNFNREMFAQKISPFCSYKKADFERSFETGKLKLVPQAVLGLFPQASSYLSPDYEQLIKDQNFKDPEDFFEAQIHDHPFEKPIREEETLAPYALDTSQEEVLRAVKSGQSVVVQGPPGSGKSELICNLICDAIAQKRNVLLVCQKKVALDVVYRRLEEKKFSDFTALVHDFKNDRKAIYNKIKCQIEFLKFFERENAHFDTIYLERTFLKLSREIATIQEQLDEFKKALFDIKDCGLSVKELYLSSSLEKPIIALKQEYAHFHFDKLDAFISTLRTYFTYAQDFDKPGYVLKDGLSFKDFNINDLQALKKVVKEIPTYCSKLFSQLEHTLESKANLSECEWLISKTRDFKDFLDMLKDPLVFKYFKSSIQDKNADLLWLIKRKKILLNSFRSIGIETHLNSEFLLACLEKADKALKANNKWFTKIWWNFFSKDKAYLENIILLNRLEKETKPLELLIERIDNRLNFEHNLTALTKAKWLIDIPDDYQYESFVDWFDAYICALQAKDLFHNLSKGMRYLKIDSSNYEDLNKNITEILKLVADLTLQKQQWLQYVSKKQINTLIDNPSGAEQMIKALDRDFDSLCEYHKLKDNLKTYEITTINKLIKAVGGYDIESAIALFENSLRITWINHIEAKYPILRSVSSLKLEQLTEALVGAIKEKQQITEKITLMNVRERTYKDVTYNRVHNMVTYRDIKHQVSKKRYIWPLRKLIQHFHSEIFNLIPCWMASPESVSAVFPMESLFDLVIFDEASQCFAEKGIPAMYRGNQVVVAGDSQQLQPFDLYRPRWEEATDDNPALEVDSLLDLATRYLNEMQLSGHYRSQSLDLIDFSNQHFYKRRLQFIPNYQILAQNQPGIIFKTVDGIWRNNRNSAEANQVVDLVKRLLSQGISSMGVITFNYYQQALIQDLLDECGENIPSEVFVKNIENVQGDERDIIIFSVGYAPEPSGKMNVQFGTLNLPKGKNRLNVAITRARKKVYVLCSFLPSQLKVDHTKNEGPKLLKNYLSYALNVSTGKYRPAISSFEHKENPCYLKDKIKDISLQHVYFESYLPFADLTVKDHEKKCRSVVFTDDDLFYQSNNAKDVFAYTPITLAKKGWKYIRFYSRHFWKNNEDFRVQLTRFVSE